jgi:hypothetical protein
VCVCVVFFLGWGGGRNSVLYPVIHIRKVVCESLSYTFILPLRVPLMLCVCVCVCVYMGEGGRGDWINHYAYVPYFL